METNKDNTPKVSIIVMANNNAPSDAVFNLLHSFYPQEAGISFEFIVIDEQNEQKAKTYSERFPWVKLIQIERLTRGSHLRNMALQLAQGEIIAFLEDHVTVRHDYLKNLLASFSKGLDIVGGSVINGNGQMLYSWVQYFCEYHKWLPSLKEGEINDLPGCNFAYRSHLLKRLGPFIEGDFKLETLFHEKAKQNGYRLFFDHQLVVKHFDDKKILKLLTYRFQYGRLFAARRGFQVWKRIIYIVFSPLIALFEYTRIFGHARYDRIYLKKFIQCTPLLLLTLFVWMAGESVGYLLNVKDLEVTV